MATPPRKEGRSELKDPSAQDPPDADVLAGLAGYLVPTGLISVDDMRAAIVGKLHGWEWNAPLSVFQGPDGEIVIGGGPPSQDKAAAMETRRNMEREAVMLLKYSASTGLLGLQFAEGGSPPRAYWDAGAGFRAIESGRFLGTGELAVYDGRPVFAKASDFDTWLGKLSISSGGDMLAAFGSVKGLDAPKPTIAAERRCQSWLEEQMRAGPQTKAKPNYQVDACSKYNLSIRAFLRAWDAAIRTTATVTWGRPGRKS